MYLEYSCIGILVQAVQLQELQVDVCSLKFDGELGSSGIMSFQINQLTILHT